MPPTTNLTPGSTGSDVLALQNYLVSQGVLSQTAMDTGRGIYGPATTKAVAALQQKLGVPAGSAAGYWGPLTIAAVNKTSAANTAVSSMTPAQINDYYKTQQNSPTPVSPAQYLQNLNNSSTSTDSGQPLSMDELRKQQEKEKAQAAEKSRQSAIIAKANSLKSSGAGSTDINNFINSLPAADRDLVSGVFGGMGVFPGTTVPLTGNAAVDAALHGINSAIQDNHAAGNVINPAIEITPELAAKFVAEAHQQLDPYYQQQITSVIGDVNANLARVTGEYRNQQAESQQNFGQNLFNQRETEAGNGTAMSGLRGKTEENMLGTQNRSLGNLDLQYGGAMRDILATGGKQIGTGAPGLTGSVNDFNLPTVPTQTATLEGTRGGAVAGNSLNTGYNPSLYTYGSVPNEFKSGLVNTSNEFLSNYLKTGVNNSRQFINNNGVPTLQ